MSTIKRNGNIANTLNQTEKDNDKRVLEEREMKIEEKKKELEEKMKEEEKLLNEARKRAQIGPAGKRFLCYCKTVLMIPTNFRKQWINSPSPS